MWLLRLGRRDISWSWLTNGTSQLLFQLIQRADTREYLTDWGGLLAEDRGDKLESIHNLRNLVLSRLVLSNIVDTWPSITCLMLLLFQKGLICSDMLAGKLIQATYLGC